MTENNTVADEQKKIIEKLENELKVLKSYSRFERKIDEWRKRLKRELYLESEETAEVPLSVFRSLQFLLEGKDLFAAHHIFSRSIGGLLRDQAEREKAYKFDCFVGEGASLENFLQSDNLSKILPVFISQNFTESNFKYFEPLYVDQLFSYEKKLSLLDIECENSVLKTSVFFPSSYLPNQYVIWVGKDPFWITYGDTLERVRKGMVDERFMCVIEIPQFYIKFKEILHPDTQYVFAWALSPIETYPVLIIENGKPRILDGMIPGMDAIFPIAGKTQMK